MKTLKATFEQFFDTEAYDSHYNIILLFFSFFFSNQVSRAPTQFSKSKEYKRYFRQQRGENSLKIENLLYTT